MKAKFLLVAMMATLFSLTSFAQPRIAVLDFNAGAGISQSDVNGLSGIFNTYFSPAGYTVVERTRVNQVLNEQGIQVSAMTESQRVRLGEILNVSLIVIGDVNYAMKQYNIDVRVVNVETGAIVAKDGAEWAEGSSYREMMRTLAERLSKNIPLVEFYRKPATPVRVDNDPLYRPTGGSLRFLVGVPDLLFSIAYNQQITSGFMVGGGVGYGRGKYVVRYWDSWGYDYDERTADCIPIYFETELRTPKYEWSLFINLKAGIGIFPEKKEDYYYNGKPEYTYEYRTFLASVTIGGSYKNLNLGVGISTWGIPDVPVVFSLSYNLPFTAIDKGLF